MIEIRILGTVPPCAKCKQAEERAKKTASKFGDQVKVTKLDALSTEAQQYGLLMTPAVVVGETVIANGKVPSEERLEAAIRSGLEGEG